MRRGSLAGAVVVAMGLVAAAIAFAVVTSLLDRADATTELRLSRLEEALEAAEEERATSEERLAQAASELERLRGEVTDLANRPVPAPVAAAPRLASAPDAPLPDVGADENFENPPTEAPTEIMLLADSRFNKGITQPRNRTMLEILGRPREDLGTDCKSVTNPAIAALMEQRTVGPVTVTMIRPAVDSLERIMDRLRETEPDIYARIGSAGALCARLIRGSATGISNHSWGTAIDLTMGGVLDDFADGGTQLGLVILAEYFNDEGWYWGATFGREDSMHFEVGEETLRAWRAAGLL